MGNSNSVIENGYGVSAPPLRRLHVGQGSVGYGQLDRGRLAGEQGNVAERDAFATGQRIERGKATGDMGRDGGCSGQSVRHVCLRALRSLFRAGAIVLVFDVPPSCGEV